MNIKFTFFFLLLSTSISVYLKNQKTVLDKFYYEEMFELYQEQYNTRECSMQQGANCFFTDSYFYHSYKDHSQQRFTDYLNTTYNKVKNIQNAKQTFTDQINKFYALSTDLQSPYQKPTAIKYSLYLTFESYDQETKKHDIYMPREKVIQFYYSTLILTFNGNLRLKYSYETSILGDENYPSKTYGIVESDELIITFNKEVSCSFFYIRSHFQKLNKQKRDMIEAYIDNQIIYSSTLPFLSQTSWMMFSFPNVKFNKLKFPGGIEIDNIMFIHETFNQFNVEVHFKTEPKRKELVTEDDIY